MKSASIPTLLDLNEARNATGGKVSTGALRAAIRRGELNAIRTSDSCSARILLDADDLGRWLRTQCSGRNVVPSPSEVAAANRQAQAAESEAQ